jgi:hypothetical protein
MAQSIEPNIAEWEVSNLLKQPDLGNFPLDEKFQSVEWKEFKLGGLFEKIKVNSLKYKASDLPNEASNKFVLPALTAGVQNQGLNNYVPKNNATILKNVISISANGANTGATFYQSKEFTILQDAYAIRWKYTNDLLTDKHYLYLTASISKTIFGHYEWTNKAGWEKIKNQKIQLPTKNGEIDFEFMESFIAELEAERIAKLKAYLLATGLKDYTLTAEEQKALEDFENGIIEWGEFSYKSIFNKIAQGRRLKKDEQISGTIPFVMAGVTNTGVVNYISNPVASFPKNSITIDIFGNTFYRNYDFGAGDDTGVYWNDKIEYSKQIMLFFTASMEKSVSGRFSYGKKLRSSQSLDFTMKLPIKNKKPDYALMETLISAIQKLVIKEVVLYIERK